MAYAIRPALASDLAALPAIEAAAATRFRTVGLDEIAESAPNGIEFLKALLRHGRISVAVAAAGEPVGFALAGVLDKAVHLYELSVDPDHGRRGVGTHLVQSVEAYAIETGLSAVTLSTFRDVPWNGPLYARLGFVEVEANAWPPAFHLLHVHEQEIGLPMDRRVFMQKELRP